MSMVQCNLKTNFIAFSATKQFLSSTISFKFKKTKKSPKTLYSYNSIFFKINVSNKLSFINLRPKYNQTFEILNKIVFKRTFFFKETL